MNKVQKRICSYTMKNNTSQSKNINECIRRIKKDKDLKDKIMTKEEVYRFVMHYERLTHYILEELPNLSDIVLTRDGNFKFSISKTP